MAVALAASPLVTTSVDNGYFNYETGYLTQLVAAQSVITTGTTAVFSVPYIAVGGKARLILNISGLTGGTSPSLAVTYNESADGGTTYNSTAAISIAAQTANGTYYSTAATGPVFNTGQLQFTVTGAPSALVASVYLAVWNR